MAKGILIVGHGSRLPKVNEEFKQLVDILRQNTGKDVRGANLTLAKPGVEETIEDMYRDGDREITLIPYFLSNGTHVVKNIPNIIEGMEERLEGLKITLETTLLMDPLVIKAMENKIYKNL